MSSSKLCSAIGSEQELEDCAQACMEGAYSLQGRLTAVRQCMSNSLQRDLHFATKGNTLKQSRKRLTLDTSATQSYKILVMTTQKVSCYINFEPQGFHFRLQQLALSSNTSDCGCSRESDSWSLLAVTSADLESI